MILFFACPRIVVSEQSKSEGDYCMPTMPEIYNNYSIEYDELVSCEDYEGNLAATILGITSFKKKRVIEFGVGTGRLTRIFAEMAERISCCDASSHMIDRAKKNLSEWETKIDFFTCDSRCFPDNQEVFDIAIEGWSFGHMIPEKRHEIGTMTETLIATCTKHLKRNGDMIMIETLGTNVDQPGPTKERLSIFFDHLEKQHGFSQKVIRTDYKFPSNSEAARVMGFFFGEKMKEAVFTRGTSIIPEYTGVWYRKCQV
jgi:ubiquinone/menaquinone biosynthesis C-methylase UbiE